VQVLINTGILAAYCSGIPYEMGFTGFDVLGGVWCSWWRIMIGAGLLPAALQVRLRGQVGGWRAGQGRAHTVTTVSVWDPHIHN
jgi:hypothetical protein